MYKTLQLALQFSVGNLYHLVLEDTLKMRYTVTFLGESFIANLVVIMILIDLSDTIQ